MNSFSDFIGNTTAVNHLRAAIATGRLPHSLILAGPRGSGKYTLALMLAQAVNCKNQPRETGPDGTELTGFCGTCTNCVRIAESHDLQTRIDEAIEARESLREVDKKETRILVQTHPDVLVLPPDPPQLLIKLGQVRSLTESIYYRPGEGERKIYIFTSTAFMKEAANALLKVLEEPPAYAHIFILAENPGELLPTIRSRCGIVRLGALPAAEIESTLATHRPEWKPAQRALVARLAQGGIGRALGFDLAAYLTGRTDALIFIQNAVNDPDHTALFKVTETYRAGADGAQKTTALLRALSSLLEDILLLQSGAPALIRNVDIEPQIEKLASALSFHWVEQASRALDQVESGMRRNLLRSLSLDAFAAQLAAR
ncbi:MAG: DNA polymerase III subunit delta' [Acidobacteriaceae bacterium]|nr:DNA polymerase III subunit delta' [Acidobacteriaceae bacterium]